MKAMVLEGISSFSDNKAPLVLRDMPAPEPVGGEILVRVSACGVCHTELDEIEGRSPPPVFPVIPGHQIVGRVERSGEEVTKYRAGDRVGVAWIHSACGFCQFCAEGRENLCDSFRATGRDVNGGYAEFVKVHQDFAYPIPDVFTDYEAAPLLCAGAVGYRALRLTGIRDGDNLGLVGFGASAHLVIQMALHRYPRANIYVFARSPEERVFAKELGAVWSGDIKERPPVKLHAAIDTTPVWRPVVEAMKNLERGGKLVINAIRKEDHDKEALFSMDYADHLWHERQIQSVANVTKGDAEEFLMLAAEIPVKPEVQLYRLEDANIALNELKERKIRGAKVIRLS